MTAPSENVSVKLNTTVYGNVVFNKKNICTKQAVPLLHMNESIKMRKTKRQKEMKGQLEEIKMCD